MCVNNATAARSGRFRCIPGHAVDRRVSHANVAGDHPGAFARARALRTIRRWCSVSLDFLTTPERRLGRASRPSLVRYQRNDYSVRTNFGAGAPALSMNLVANLHDHRPVFVERSALRELSIYATRFSLGSNFL